MIPETFIGNAELETEYLASQILEGIILPDSYTDLRISLASIPIIDVSNNLTNKLILLQKEVSTKYGFLDDKPIKDFFFGKNPELKKLLKSIEKEVLMQQDLYGIAKDQQLEQSIDTISQHAETMDYEILARGVALTGMDRNKIDSFEQTKVELQKAKSFVTASLASYGRGEVRLPTKGIPAKLSTQYKLFLHELSSNLDQVTSNIRLSFVLAKATDSIISLFPKDDLDPYLTDVCNNFLDVISNPKSFYSKCQQDEIVSSAVGQLFAHCYPEFYNRFQDMYLDDYNNMDYQEQIEFKKCFALGSEDPSLTSLCSNYIKLGFKHQ